MTDRPILYSFRRCPYAMRARMTLLIAGILCEIREVKLSAKPVEMIAVSPKGTVPVMVLGDGTVIDQSLDIMRWALEGWPPPPRHFRFRGNDELSLALIEANDGPFKHHLDRYKYPDRHDDDAAAHRDAGVAVLRDYDDRLRTHAHLLGDSPSIADIAILPFVRQFAAVDQAWFDAQPLPGVQRWLAEFVASSLFERTMVRLSPWRPDDTVVEFGAPPSPSS